VIHHAHPRHRTVALVRLLHSLAPAKRRRGRRPLPRQQQPDGIRVGYYRALQRLVVAPALAAVRAELPNVLRLLENTTRADADDEGSALEMLQRALGRAGRAVNERELHGVAEQFGKQTTTFQKVQLDRQVRAAVGVPFSAVEKPTTDRMPGFITENVSLIKTVPERYFEGVQDVVRQAFAEGWSTDRLTAAVSERGQVADSNARRIARDQVGKLNAQVNQDRQEALGVTGYIWRGVLDQRERDAHTDREGKHFDWDDPPEDGHPGEPVQCRCSAEPDFDSISTAVETGEAPDEGDDNSTSPDAGPDEGDDE
jgi:SPP1 gp7 family putative phage head morphogenesis protein